LKTTFEFGSKCVNSLMNLNQLQKYRSRIFLNKDGRGRCSLGGYEHRLQRPLLSLFLKICTKIHYRFTI